VLAMGFGYEVKGLNDPKVNASRKLAQVVIETALPGALLVNDLPFCEYSMSYWTSSALIHNSAIRPWMASVVELQAARSIWLQYSTGGLTWADRICQRKYSECF